MIVIRYVMAKYYVFKIIDKRLAQRVQVLTSIVLKKCEYPFLLQLVIPIITIWAGNLKYECFFLKKLPIQKKCNLISIKKI